MITNFDRGSAKIYQFSARVRTATDGDRGKAKPTADFASPRVSETTFGSGWYHEAAVQDADPVHKR